MHRFVAPEILNGRNTERGLPREASDVYSICATIFNLLMGEEPWAEVANAKIRGKSGSLIGLKPLTAFSDWLKSHINLTLRYDWRTNRKRNSARRWNRRSSSSANSCWSEKISSRTKDKIERYQLSFRPVCVWCLYRLDQIYTQCHGEYIYSFTGIFGWYRWWPSKVPL